MGSGRCPAPQGKCLALSSRATPRAQPHDRPPLCATLAHSPDDLAVVSQDGARVPVPRRHVHSWPAPEIYRRQLIPHLSRIVPSREDVALAQLPVLVGAPARMASTVPTGFT